MTNDTSVPLSSMLLFLSLFLGMISTCRLRCDYSVEHVSFSFSFQGRDMRRRQATSVNLSTLTLVNLLFGNLIARG